MTIHPENRTERIALLVPGALDVFERWGVDYFSHGHDSLLAACRAARAKVDDVIADLAKAEVSGETAPDSELENQTVCQLVDGIGATCARPEEAACARVEEALARSACPGVHSALIELKDALANHIRLEAYVFEQLRALQRAREGTGPWPQPGLLSLRGDLASLKIENGMICDALCALSKCCKESNPAGGASAKQDLMNAVAELEAAVHHQIHLENNLLLPRAMNLIGATEGWE